MRAPLPLVLAAALALPAGVQPAAAQVSVRVQSGDVPAPRAGWLGISVDLQARVEANHASTARAVVTAVQPGSPAEAAGVREGDVILALDGRLLSDGLGGVDWSFVVGRPVTLDLERAGRLVRTRVVPAPRPRASAPTGTWVVTVTDSVADRLARAMDSLRIRLERDGPEAVVTVGGAPRPGSAPQTLEVTVGEAPQAWHVRPFAEPFAFGFSTEPQPDPVRGEVRRLQRALQDVRAREVQRLQELARLGEPPQRDSALVRLARTRAALEEESARLARTVRDATRDMAEMAREAQRQAWVAATAPATAANLAAEAAELAASFRPLEPYVLGRNRVAGAEVVDLNEGLAGYFGTARGVLVVDVAPGTPAARAGVRAGDVVTEVGGSEVGSVRSLRAALRIPDDTVSLAVVRRGRVLRMRLHR